jgi:hypothetical protein
MAPALASFSVAGFIFTVLLVGFINLLIYIAFRPFTAGLRDTILLAVLSVGVLGAIFGTILREQGPALLPVNFLISAVILAVWMTMFHLIERRVLGLRD